MTRISRWLLKGLARGGWAVLGLALVAGITVAAWAVAGYIEPRPAGFWYMRSRSFSDGLVFGQYPGYVGLMTALLLLVIWSRWRRAVRLRRGLQLLSQLRMAVSLNLPLPATFASAAEGESRRNRRQMESMRDSLSAGLPVSLALQAAAPELPPRILETIAVAEQTGTLEPAIERLIAEHAVAGRQDVSRLAVQRMYSLITLAMLGAVLSMLMVFVVPKFEQILKDFNVPAPRMMVLAIELFRTGWPFLLFAMVWVLLFVMAARAAKALFVRAAPVPLWRELADRVQWMLPVGHAVARDRGMADTCELLADGLSHGRPAAAALQLAILPTTNRVLARRLHEWQQLVEHGRPLHEAAGTVGLPQLVVALLAPAPYTASMADACRFLAGYYRDRNERLLAVLRAAYAPVATLLLGSLVLATAFTLFNTMELLNQAVSGWLPGVKP